MKRTLGAIGTVLLHIAIVAALLHITNKIGAPPGHLGRDDLRLLDERKLKAKGEPLITVPVKLAEFGKPASIDPPCLGPSYRGIGIRRYFGGAIFEVAPGSPAEQSGLRIGDVMLNDEILGPDRYPVGTKLVLRMERDGREFDAPIVIGEICEDK